VHLVYEGILLGLTLAIMLGPIFVATTQTSIEKGYLPGLTVGLGIWTSDFIFISSSLIFIKYLQALTESKSFVFWVGLLGGIVLLVFGVSMLFKKHAAIDPNLSFKAKNYLGFWAKGFFVNTLNPFTFIFWFGITSSYVIGRKMTSQETLIFLSCIYGTIIFTDWLKIYLAKWLRNHLNAKHLGWISKISGTALLVFGIILLVRSYLYV
jgi:threonine/homoserine/homoserine lactone efflux protein